MRRVGIIAEFNPLHTGHAYLLSAAKTMGEVACVISGNFVQRGDTAVVSKEVRAKAALLSGADLVAELPVLWSMSTAQNFALGGVSALMDLGCDTLLFGSEAGEIDPLLKAAQILESDKFSRKLNEFSNKGLTFAKARKLAFEELGGQRGILDRPNNNLGIEYIIAAHRMSADFEFITIKRQGADHDSLEINEFVSATLLRERLLSGERELCKAYIPPRVLELIRDEELSDIKNIEAAILGILRLKTLEELRALPDISEGLENKIFSAIRVATSLEELYNEIKVKRYPLARIRRLVLSAVLGFDNNLFMKPPPYVRILGKTSAGNNILKTAKARAVTRVSQIKDLGDSAQRVFDAECRATDLFSLSLAKPRECGKEYTFKLITEE